jgi:hypothetical protein
MLDFSIDAVRFNGILSLITSPFCVGADYGITLLQAQEICSGPTNHTGGQSEAEAEHNAHQDHAYARMAYSKLLAYTDPSQLLAYTDPNATVHWQAATYPYTTSMEEQGTAAGRTQLTNPAPLLLPPPPPPHAGAGAGAGAGEGDGDGVWDGAVLPSSSPLDNTTALKATPAERAEWRRMLEGLVAYPVQPSAVGPIFAEGATGAPPVGRGAAASDVDGGSGTVPTFPPATANAAYPISHFAAMHPVRRALPPSPLPSHPSL